MANETVFQRYPRNPIITPEAVPGANSIFNSAVIPFDDRCAGIFRVDMNHGAPQLHLGWSDDALRWRINPDPIQFQSDDPDLCYSSGYDPRVTDIGGAYYITWCNDYHGPGIGLAETKDFKSFHMISNPLPPFNRNAVLFPRKIGGAYAMLHRPSDPGHTPFGDIFYCTSPDLVHWGNHRWVLGPRGGWQSMKVGAGPVPIETPEGWLMIYHGVKLTCSGYIYSAGAALLDLDEPWKVRRRTRRYLLAPTEAYERVGDVPNVVFPIATLLDDATGRLALYYGCADTCIGVAYAQLEAVIAFIKANSFEDNP
ncbi:MAG: glycoside hydrolase family 130 protein [Armatimonadota bacterium]|nr:MAG: glycoside hydrolase family 130 protein [Armatimonadota bacterium]